MDVRFASQYSPSLPFHPNLFSTVGGVLVTIGWSYAAANGALCRVGGGQFGVGKSASHRRCLFYYAGRRRRQDLNLTRPFSSFLLLYAGGGTIFHTGFSFARAIGAGAFFGAGVTHVNGGGTLTYIGGSYVSFVISTIFAGVGYWTFQGAGSSTIMAVPQSRYAVTHNVVRERGEERTGSGHLRLFVDPNAPGTLSIPC